MADNSKETPTPLPETKHWSAKNNELLYLAKKAYQLGNAAMELFRLQTETADANLEQARQSLARKYVDVVYCKDYAIITPRGGTKQDK